MNHLSNDRIVALAEGGAPAQRGEEGHLAVCPACARELEETASLLAAIRSGDDPPLPDERMALNAARIEARVAAIRPRAVPRHSLRWSILVPLAAAAVAVILPRTRDSVGGPVLVTSVQEAGDLSEDELDVLVRCLASATEEFGVIQEVIDRGDSPWEDIGDMSGDELESLLNIMGVNKLG